MSFIQNLHAEGTKGVTANGAVTYTTSGSDLLNFYAQAGAMRGKINDAVKLFAAAYAEDKLRAIRCAFYIRDVRGGQGERDLFRAFLNWIRENDKDTFNAIIPHVSEYGRWDDLFAFINSLPVSTYLRDQLASDIQAEKPSLLAKWLPTINASSEQTKAEARQMAKAFGVSELIYRRAVRDVRKRLNTVEEQMSAQKWRDINYSHVPSQASKLYRKAFKRHDEKRYTDFITAATKGEVKINATTLYPYQIYKMFTKGGLSPIFTADPTAEALWKALPDYTRGNNALVIADVSGSMFSGQTDVAPISVSVSLALYFAERNKGQFKDYFMTFDSTPKIVKVKGNTTAERFREIASAPWGGSTDIQAAFDLLLSTAKKYKTPVEEMPSTIYIISDMEFNVATGVGFNVWNRQTRQYEFSNGNTNFEEIDRKYRAAGYERPTIVFWNVNARAGNLPVTKDQNNTTLVSGFSPTVFAQVVEGLSPQESMLKVLDGPRYSKIVLD